MARHSRTVADRQRSLEPVPPEANFTLFAVREMYEGTRSARRLTLHLPRRWPWEEQFSRALARLRAIPLPA